VHENRSHVTNLPWVVDGAEIAAVLGLAHVPIINDLEAVGWGLDYLSGDQLVCLHDGAPEVGGTQGIVAPGTGLGEAFRVWDGRRYLTRASEGSHADFAPNDERECLLQGWLAAQYGHVSWERAVSGPGLRTLHRFIVESEGAEVPDWLEVAMTEGDPSAAIVAAARAGRDAVCMDAVHWFLRLLGAEAGNHALKVMATGGVYLAGGIPPRLADLITGEAFLERFFSKGRMSALMRRMPVYVVMDDRVALLGAAACAVDRVESGS
jgi:glucokinase